jgi:hypothetical protein
MLEKELETFKIKKAELLLQNPNGGFVVIKDDKVLGVWQSRMDALKFGIEEFGNVPFLVKSITESDVSINFTRNLIFA